MQTNFEQFALTSMLGQEDSPPRLAGKLCFGEEWQRTAFGVALALSKFGYFDWEDFRQQLIAVIGEWERSHDLGDASWNYYECWLTALERVILDKALVGPEEVENLLARLPAEFAVPERQDAPLGTLDPD
jgi:nitrile hydratase accessory protein